MPCGIVLPVVSLMITPICLEIYLDDVSHGIPSPASFHYHYTLAMLDLDD